MILDNIDCLAHIFSYLSVRERETYRQVCQRWLASVDELARTQQSLSIIGKRDGSSTLASVRPFSLTGSRLTSTVNSPFLGHTIHWPNNFIRYQCFCLMLYRFPNIRAIHFESIDHWNDHLLSELTTLCPNLKSLSFVRCVGLGRSRMLEKDYMNVTINGWHRLIQQYGQQVTALTLQDCDLDDHQLQIVVDGFRRLKYLDITSNRIVNASALQHICPDIEVLKVGPRLMGNNVSADIPIAPIMAGNGRFVRELSLQGFLNANLNLVAQMNNLTKLTIRFMKPLFEDINISNCFTAIGHIHSLLSLEIYQHNTHDCYMALSHDHLVAIFSGCNLLERFVLNCDIWCDSPLDDQLIAYMRQCCPRLTHLDLCPGNFQTTDQSLLNLSFARLKFVRIVEFSGITELGLMHFVRRTPSLTEFIVEDCCDINSENMINFVRTLFNEHPDRHLDMVITPLRSLQIPTEVFHFPECNPKYRLTIYGQKDRNKQSGFLRSGKGILSSHCCSAYYSVSCLLIGTFNTVLSIIKFTSTLLTFGAACCFYLLHLVLLSVNSRFSFNNLVLGIPFLTTSMMVFLSSLFIGPFMYLSSHLISLFSVDLQNVLDGLSEIYSDGHS